MKKSLLMLTAAFLLVGLAGCDNTSTPVGSDSTGGSTTPATGGLVGVDFSSVTGELGENQYIAAMYLDDDVTLPEYVSPFITGSYTETAKEDGTWDTTWATGVNAGELTPMAEGSRVYIATITWDEENYGGTQQNEYSVVLGYNEASGLGEAARGLQWVDSYKSVQVATYPYPSNPTWEAHDKVLWLNTANAVEEASTSGVHNFSKIPPKPIELANYHLVYGFKAAVPTWAKAIAVGTFSAASWGYAESLVMTQVAEADINPLWGEGYVFYEVNIGTVIASSALSFKIVLEAADATAITWSYQMTPDNVSFTPLSSDGDNARTWVANLDIDPSSVYPDPALYRSVEFRLVNVTGSTVTGQGEKTPAMPGSHNGWSVAADFTWDAENSWWDYTTFVAFGHDYEFGIVVSGDSNWTGKIVAADGTNAHFQTVEATTAVVLTVDYAYIGAATAEDSYGNLQISYIPAIEAAA